MGVCSARAIRAGSRMRPIPRRPKSASPPASRPAAITVSAVPTAGRP